MTKITYTDALTIALTADLPEEVKDKLNALRDQIAKRNATENRKPTKAQRENAELKAVVMEVMTTDPATVTEIMTRDPKLVCLSNQKVSALLHALVAEDKLIKTVEKRVSKFALA